ncbi:MAG: hypothetical protein K6E24_01530 [bacterium]|nr:hypothetical protein [bacterium]
MTVNNIEVVLTGTDNMKQEEIEAYIQRGKEAEPKKELAKIEINVDGEFVDLKYHYNMPFERIRRITGYLVGTTDRWNNAKKAELRDRVKHD